VASAGAQITFVSAGKSGGLAVAVERRLATGTSAMAKRQGMSKRADMNESLRS
jgi:hypothetical protein